MEDNEEGEKVKSDDLSYDVIFVILSYLDVDSKYKIALTSKEWSFSVSSRSDRIWEKVFLKTVKGTILDETEMKIVNGLGTIFEKYSKLKELEYLKNEELRKRFEKMMDISYVDISKLLSSSVTPKIKCTVLGERYVGKSCLFSRVRCGIFPGPVIPNVFDKEEKKLNFGGSEVTLEWEVINEYDYDYYEPKKTHPGTNIFLLCFSVSDRYSFESVGRKFIHDVKCHNRAFPDDRAVLIVCGCKVDLRSVQNSSVSTEEGTKMAKKLKAVRYIETSSKTNINVSENDILLRLIFTSAIAPDEVKKGNEPNNSGGICGIM